MIPSTIYCCVMFVLETQRVVSVKQFSRIKHFVALLNTTEIDPWAFTEVTPGLTFLQIDISLPVCCVYLYIVVVKGIELQI